VIRARRYRIFQIFRNTKHGTKIQNAPKLKRRAEKIRAHKMSDSPNEMPSLFDEAAKTNLFHARNAVAHCKLAWKEYSEVLGNARNIAFPGKESEEGTTTVFDSKRCEVAREKLQASIEHVERTYEEVKRDTFLEPLLREARKSRPPHALSPKEVKERSVFFGASLGNLLSHYEGKFRLASSRGFENEDLKKSRMRTKTIEKKMKQLIGGPTPYDGALVVYAVDERGKRVGFNAAEVNERCRVVKAVSSGNFECRVPWDGWNIESILGLEIGPDDWKKREEEEREEEKDEDEDEGERTKKRAKTVAKKSWTDGPDDAKKKDEDASSSMISEFAKVSLRKKSVAEMMNETNDEKAFEKFTEMARERAKENIKKYCGEDGKKGAAVMALAMLLEWFEDFHATSQAAKNANGDGEMQADPRTCGVEVPKRYLPEYYKDSETKDMTYQDVLKQERAKEEEEKKKKKKKNEENEDEEEEEEEEEEEGELKE